LGRQGVRVFVLASETEAEIARSRFVTAVLGPPLSAEDDPANNCRRVNDVMRAIGGECVGIAGDDESAVFLAENRDVLDPRLLTFPVEPELPRQLSDKVTLGDIAHRRKVPYPPFLTSSSPQAIAEFAAAVGLPLVAKSPAPYARLRDESVPHTHIMQSPADLRNLARSIEVSGHAVFVQKFVAGPGVETWYGAGLATVDPRQSMTMTGRKMLAHPTGSGIGVISVAEPFAELSAMVSELCREIGYLGPFDTDWMVDVSSGAVSLIDFNPRRGAQFRTFQTTTGMDVVRATHLALTGRWIDWGRQVFGVTHVVENLAFRHGRRGRPGRYRQTSERPAEWAWWSRDDPSPSLKIAGDMARSLVGRLTSVGARSR
jgi:predicted ATP-grasp superfamily ATP-dependent carboligase